MITDNSGFTAEELLELDAVTRDCADKLAAIDREVEAAGIELDKLKGHNKSRDHHDAVTQLVDGEAWVSSAAKAAAITLLKSELDLEGDQLVQVGQDGNRVVGGSGFKTGQEYILEFIKNNPHMVKTPKPSQSTGAASGDGQEPTMSQLRKLFGSSSNGRAAQDFFVKDPQRYRAWREIAKSRGAF